MTTQTSLDVFFQRQRHISTHTSIWAKGAIHLTVSAYLTQERPPKELVSSARAIVTRNDCVLVSTNIDGRHLLPGGRVEPGETFEETIRRELLEEAGVEVAVVKQIGIVRLHHTTPKPPGHKYPYPDFLWVVFHATHIRDVPEAKQKDDYEVSAEFVPVEILDEKKFGDHEIAYLRAAMAGR